jgi:3-hydroxyisobutyrate dehydrogenase-like beta-hydroxyacid dehydrogenase
MFEHDFEPLFKLEHMLKDIRHCLSEVRDLGIDPTVTEVVEKLFADAVEDGHGQEDFAAIVTEAEKRA